MTWKPPAIETAEREWRRQCIKRPRFHYRIQWTLLSLTFLKLQSSFIAGIVAERRFGASDEVTDWIWCQSIEHTRFVLEGSRHALIITVAAGTLQAAGIFPLGGLKTGSGKDRIGPSPVARQVAQKVGNNMRNRFFIQGFVSVVYSDLWPNFDNLRLYLWEYWYWVMSKNVLKLWGV
jgi:hypothetical protein